MIIKRGVTSLGIIAYSLCDLHVYGSYHIMFMFTADRLRGDGARVDTWRMRSCAPASKSSPSALKKKHNNPRIFLHE